MPTIEGLMDIPDGSKLADKDRLETPWTTEYDVLYHLAAMGHKVKPLGVYSDLSKIREGIEAFKPHIVFNLLEEFDGEAVFDSNVVSYLELLKIPYTGCNPRGLMIARDKSLTKKVLIYHRIKTPKFAVFPKNRRTKVPKYLRYPLIVKCLDEDASLGLSKASIVSSEEKLLERIQYIHKKIGVDAIVEEFVEGREFYIGVIGNYRMELLPVWEVFYNNANKPEKEFYSRSAKWNDKYRQRKGIDSGKAQLSADLEKKCHDIAKRTYKSLGLNGYARIDVRMDADENIYVIEANPNPNIAIDDEFAESSYYKNQWDFHKILQKIINNGLSWNKGS
ncbi:MAG: ATP-grasp domain-containing protein [Bacteriovoracaceae bacterium]|nr:ATP-grasp domain-containing protein [Bacteriovoracaceae bacterium]